MITIFSAYDYDFYDFDYHYDFFFFILLRAYLSKFIEVLVCCDIDRDEQVRHNRHEFVGKHRLLQGGEGLVNPPHGPIKVAERGVGHQVQLATNFNELLVLQSTTHNEGLESKAVLVREIRGIVRIL